MRYALIENGIVTNLIWLYEGNAGEFPGAVPLGDVPAAIGDTYAGGTFFRDGAEVRSPLDGAKAVIAELDAAVIDLTYQNVLLEAGVTEEA